MCIRKWPYNLLQFTLPLMPLSPAKEVHPPPLAKTPLSHFGSTQYNTKSSALYKANSHQPGAGTSQNAFLRIRTDRISVYPPPPPQTVPKMGFFTW